MSRQLCLMHVAVGVILSHDQKVLIAQRPAHKYKGGLWEFPGGKLEPGETAIQALARELKEEIGVVIHSAIPWLSIHYAYEDRKVLLDTWIVKEFGGQPVGREGQSIQWVETNCLDNFIFPDGNRLIIEKLKSDITSLPGDPLIQCSINDKIK